MFCSSAPHLKIPSSENFSRAEKLLRHRPSTLPRRTPSQVVSFLITLIAISLVPLNLLKAQEFQEGAGGTIDKKRRSPVIGLDTERTASEVKILVDAYIPNEEYRAYPIRFEIFVNRHLLVSQIRSPELPGAIGVTVPPTIAAPPFNYSIVATVIHPNRQFSSVAQGAVYPVDLSGTLSCEVKTTNQGENDSVQTLEFPRATASQSAPNRMRIALAGPHDTEAQRVAELELSGTTVLGSLSDGVGGTSSISGSLVIDGAQRVQSLDVSGSGGLPSLSCNRIEGQPEDLSVTQETSFDIFDPALSSSHPASGAAPTVYHGTGEETFGGGNSSAGAVPNENDESEIIDALLP